MTRECVRERAREQKKASLSHCIGGAFDPSAGAGSVLVNQSAAVLLFLLSRSLTLSFSGLLHQEVALVGLILLWGPAAYK